MSADLKMVARNHPLGLNSEFLFKVTTGKYMQISDLLAHFVNDRNRVLVAVLDLALLQPYIINKMG